MVPGAGVEPARGFPRGILSPSSTDLNTITSKSYVTQNQAKNLLLGTATAQKRYIIYLYCCFSIIGFGFDHHPILHYSLAFSKFARLMEIKTIVFFKTAY